MPKPKSPENSPRGRGKPRLGAGLRKPVSVSVDPALEAYAREKWGGLSAAVNDLLARDRARAERRRAAQLSRENRGK